MTACSENGNTIRHRTIQSYVVVRSDRWKAVTGCFRKLKCNGARWNKHDNVEFIIFQFKNLLGSRNLFILWIFRFILTIPPYFSTPIFVKHPVQHYLYRYYACAFRETLWTSVRDIGATLFAETFSITSLRNSSKTRAPPLCIRVQTTRSIVFQYRPIFLAASSIPFFLCAMLNRILDRSLLFSISSRSKFSILLCILFFFFSLSFYIFAWNIFCTA